MAHVFTNSELAIFQYVLDVLLLGKAYQLPPDSNTIDQLARVAKSSGFMPDSRFKEAMRDRPISTLIDFFLNTAVLSAQNVSDLSYARNRLVVSDAPQTFMDDVTAYHLARVGQRLGEGSTGALIDSFASSLVSSLVSVVANGGAGQGFTVINGDPQFGGELSQPYFLTATYVAGQGVILTWQLVENFAHPTGVYGFGLQRSASSTNLTCNNPTCGCSRAGFPATDSYDTSPDWMTIFSESKPTSTPLSQFTTTHTDSVVPNPRYNYRLILRMTSGWCP